MNPAPFPSMIAIFNPAGEPGTNQKEKQDK